MKEVDFGGIIPEYAAVVFDEAHDIEDVAGQYFGVGVSNYQFQDLQRDVAALSRRKQFGSQELDRILDTMRDRADTFFFLFGETDGRVGFRGHAAFLATHEEHYTDVLHALELLHAHIQLVKEAPEEAIPLCRRAQELSQKLQFWMRGDDRSFVYWIERRGRGVFLQATPIDVSSMLKTRLFDSLDTVILTSATLAVGGAFEFTEKRLGIQGARDLIVPSHFEYQKQALLYVPQHLPDPRSPAFTAAAAGEVTRLLEHSAADAPSSCSPAISRCRIVYRDRVSLLIEYPTLLQGTGPRNALLDEFRRTPNCVLFATSSFWQGVDVQGEQLKLRHYRHKLPFAVPEATLSCRHASKTFVKPAAILFYDYQIPQAALALKQGFGRLIRSRSDRGVLVLLDNRITKQRYGQVFFDSLPDYGVQHQYRRGRKVLSCLRFLWSRRSRPGTPCVITTASAKTFMAIITGYGLP